MAALPIDELKVLSLEHICQLSDPVPEILRVINMIDHLHNQTTDDLVNMAKDHPKAFMTQSIILELTNRPNLSIDQVMFLLNLSGATDTLAQLMINEFEGRFKCEVQLQSLVSADMWRESTVEACRRSDTFHLYQLKLSKAS